MPPEFIRPVSSPELIVMPDLDQPDNAKTPESLDEREAVITEDITRNLVNHISQWGRLEYFMPALKDPITQAFKGSSHC